MSSYSHTTQSSPSVESGANVSIKRTFSGSAGTAVLKAVGSSPRDLQSDSQSLTENADCSSSPPSYQVSVAIPSAHSNQYPTTMSNNASSGMNGNTEEGHIVNQAGGPSKGEYRMVSIQDDEQPPSVKAMSAGIPGAGLLSVPESTSHPALSIASYCSASILMTVINKFVLSGHHFTMNFLLLTIQSLVCVLCVVSCKRAKLINFRDFDKEDARKWFPISFLLVLVIYTGSKSLQYLTIPVYTIFKNLTIILIAYGEVIWFGGSVTGMSLISFGLMVLSSFIAAWDDVSRYLSHTAGNLQAPSAETAASNARTAAGYAWMMINCLASAGYVLGMRKRIKVTNFKDWDSMFYNNLLSIPVLAIFSLLFEDWSAQTLQLNFPAEGRNLLILAMVISGLGAVFISYSTAWCVRTTTSTTYSMVGALNKLPVAASGLIFFNDPVTFSSVTGIFTGFVAGLVYTLAKQTQQSQKNSRS